MRSLRRSRPWIWLGMTLLLSLRGGLASLLADLLTLEANTLAAVRLRRAEPPDLRRRLAHLLLVGARQDDERALGVGGDRDGDAVGHREVDRVREPEREVQRLALQLGAIAGTDELERLRVAGGGALDHPVDD